MRLSSTQVRVSNTLCLLEYIHVYFVGDVLQFLVSNLSNDVIYVLIDLC